MTMYMQPQTTVQYRVQLTQTPYERQQTRDRHHTIVPWYLTPTTIIETMITYQGGLRLTEEKTASATQCPPCPPRPDHPQPQGRMAAHDARRDLLTRNSYLVTSGGMPDVIAVSTSNVVLRSPP